jgi:hypothetical protein
MRRLLPNGIAGVAVFVLLAIAAAGTAVAYFTTTGAGDSDPAAVSAIGTPTIAAATPESGGTVALTWSAVTAPGSGTVTYTVSRNGEKADGTCSSTLTVVTCIDSGLEPGTYTYVVTAKWRTWSTVSSGKAATVAVGPINRFVLSASSLTPTAGAADNLTVTAKDAKGGTVTTYAGSHNITFSGAPAGPNGTVPTVADSSGAATAFGTATALTFTSGVASVSSTTNGVMKLYKSGATSIEASDGTTSTATPLAVTVAAATASKFVPTAVSATPTAGEADNLTIAAIDAYGNLAISYNGSKSVTFSGATTIGSFKPTVVNSSGTATAFGTATAITFSAGVATVSSSKNGAMTLYKAESASISVAEGTTVTTATPLAVTVAPATAAKLALGATTTTPTAGAADNLTVTAQDAYGNTATGYTGSKSLTFSGPLASPSGEVPTVSNSAGTDIPIGSATALSFNAGVAAASAGKNGEMTAFKSGAASLKVGDGALTEATLSLTVGPATAAKLTLAAVATTLAAGEADNLTITALDTYGNTATAYTGSKSLTFSGAATVGTKKPTVVNSSGTATAFGTATAISFTTGIATVASAKNGVMAIYAAGKAGVNVSDGTISSASPLEVTVSPLTATKLGLAAATTTPAVGEADNLTVTAQDTYGNTDPAYAGAKSLTYSGPLVSPAGNNPTVSDSSGSPVAFGSATPTTFSAGVAGVSGSANGVMKLYKLGAATITVSDGALSGTLATTTTSTATKLILAAASTTPVPAAADNLTITAQDAYENTVTTYTGSKNLTFSGASTSPSGTAPTVANSSGTATNFGTATAITFTSGVATVSTTKNGVMKLYRAESANVSVSDGTISSAPVAITVSPLAASRWGFTSVTLSAGSLAANCVFACTVTSLGNSGTVKAKVAVTDAYGNTVSALGSGHSAKVTVTSGSGTVSGSPLAIPATGAAETATTFTFTSKSSGTFTETITAAAQEGTAYTTATLTATK